MAEPFLGEIRVFSFGYAPQGWAACDGQLLSVGQYSALFSLLGTQFGGDGVTTFGLPDLRARTPIHDGDRHHPGERGGEESHTLQTQEMPTHSHTLRGTINNGATPSPYNGVLASFPKGYIAAQNLTSLGTTTLGSAGAGHPHDNKQPFLTLNYCMALVGVYPPRP